MSGKILKGSMLIALISALFLSIDVTPASATTWAGAEAVSYIEHHDMYRPYVYGATGPYSFDCSGLIQSAFHHSSGRYLPRTAEDQWLYLERHHHASWNHNPQRGDIIFFHSRSGYVFHEGIYVGDGWMIDANSTRGYVKWDRAYYNWGFAYTTFGWVS